MRRLSMCFTVGLAVVREFDPDTKRCGTPNMLLKKDADKWNIL